MLVDDMIRMSTKIEGILSEMDAEGRGLKEKLNSISDKVDEETAKKIRFIAAIRNKMVHEPDFEVDEETEAGLQRAYDYVLPI